MCTSLYCIKSKLRHCNSFLEHERQLMFDNFWKCSWEEKRTFCINMVSKQEKKQETIAAAESSRRNLSYTYHLKSGDVNFVVCKTMFLNTLGLNEWMVRNWLDSSNQVNGLPKTKLKKIGSNEVATDEDQYEISPRRSVLMRYDHLNVWIDSLAKMPSHY